MSPATLRVKPYPHDKLLAATVLKLIPRRVTPNQVTIFRFLATPFVVWLAIDQQYLWTIVAFLLVASTDAIDGAMARTRNQVTEWGSIYDPVADKLLIGSLVIVLVARYLNLSLAVVVVAIELLFILAGYFWKRTGHTVTANAWGKTKMFLQVLGVLFLLVALAYGMHPLFITLSLGAFGLAVVFAIVSLATQGI